MKIQACDRAGIDFSKLKDLGNRLIVTGTLAIAGQWMRYLNEDQTERWEYLPPETLFDFSSLSTLQGAPLAIQHPGAVTTDNYRELVAKGEVVGSVSTQINIDRDHNQLDIVGIIYDKPTIDLILKGAITELSPQYWKEIKAHPDFKDGCYIQKARDYTGCEVSLVKKARGGKDAKLHLALDSAKAPPKKYFLNPPNINNIKKPMATINIDGIDLEIESRDKKLIEKALQERDDKIKNLTESSDAANKAIALLESEKATLEATNSILSKQNESIKQQAKDEADKREREETVRIAIPLFKSFDSQFDLSVLEKSSNREIKEEAIAIALDSLPAVIDKRLDKCSDTEINSYWQVVCSQNHQPNAQSSIDSTSELKEALKSIKRIDQSFDSEERRKLEEDSMINIENAWMQNRFEEVI